MDGRSSSRTENSVLRVVTRAFGDTPDETSGCIFARMEEVLEFVSHRPVHHRYVDRCRIALSGSTSLFSYDGSTEGAHCPWARCRARHQQCEPEADESPVEIP